MSISAAGDKPKRNSKAKNGKGPKPQPTPRLTAPPRASQRETRYSEAVMDEIMRRISHGETLTQACASNPDYPSAPVVIDWVHENRHNLAERYARARDRQLERWSDDLVDTSATAIKNPETAPGARLMLDAKKFLLSRLRPQVYGERMAITGADGKDLIPNASASLEWLRRVLAEPPTPLRLEAQQVEPPVAEALLEPAAEQPDGERIVRFDPVEARGRR